MLPQNSRSVRELERIEARVTSTSTLHLLVGAQDFAAIKRFIDDFVALAPTALGDLVDRVEYNATPVIDFFRHHEWLYLDLEDLQTVKDRVAQQINYEKMRQSPLFIDLGARPSLNFDDLQSKVHRHHRDRPNFREGYFTNLEQDLAIVVLKPTVGATDVKTVKYLIQRVQQVVDQLGPQRYHPTLRTGFGGRYQKLVVEYETIVGDMLRTIVLCVLLVSSIVGLYFRRLRVIVLMVGAAGMGTLMALVSARLTIGYLTAQTAFLGSIILGNGINYSLIVMARFLEECGAAGTSNSTALATALSRTWRPTFASALTTSLAFAALGITNIRGLNQFGLIGSIGIMACWAATFSVLPAWIVVTQRLRPLRNTAHNNGPPFGWLLRPIAALVSQRPRAVLLGAVGVTILCVISAVRYLPAALEYNFNNLRFRPAAPAETWEAHARDSADEIFGQSASPAVLLADRIDQVRPLCAAIEARAASVVNARGDPLVDECRSIFSFIPLHQREKLALLAELRTLLDDESLATRTPEEEDLLARLRATAELAPITQSDLPALLREVFRENDGREGLVVYLYPTRIANLWDGHELVQFADLIRRVQLPGSETIHASGESVIFADLLHAIVTEGPRTTLSSFLLVLLGIWILFRRQRRAFFSIIGVLCIGILWMICLFPVVGVKLNFLNFVALPIAFGIGVDYAVNIYSRATEHPGETVREGLLHIGSVVLLCSLTTMFGYAVLMVSRNRALASLGTAALLGELACLTSALCVLPAWLAWRRPVPAHAGEEPPCRTFPLDEAAGSATLMVHDHCHGTDPQAPQDRSPCPS